MKLERRQKVLVVDDEAAVLSLLKAILEAEGYSVSTALDAEAAQEYLSVNGGVDLLVTDIEMPGTSGIELAADVSKKRPTLPVLFVTGGGVQVKPSRGQPAPNILIKPFTVCAFLASVQALLNHG